MAQMTGFGPVLGRGGVINGLSLRLLE